jgi:CRISPR-associated protein Cas1
LREHGFRCTTAAIYFAGDRRRVQIEIDDALIDTTLRAVRRVSELARVATAPAPLVDSPKCVGCSLAGICLPDEVNLLKRLSADALEAEAPTHPPPAASAEPSEDDEARIRQLHPTRDDLVPLYVQEPGAYVGLNGERLRIRSRDGTESEARLVHTSQVCLFGNVQVSTQAVRALLERGIPISYFTTGGWFVGRANGIDP